MKTRYFKAKLPNGWTARSSTRPYVCCDSRGSWSMKQKPGAYPAVETDARTYRAILAGKYQEAAPAPVEPEGPLTTRQHIQAALASDEQVDVSPVPEGIEATVWAGMTGTERRAWIAAQERGTDDDE